jgi:hypothetical protein
MKTNIIVPFFVQPLVYHTFLKLFRKELSVIYTDMWLTSVGFSFFRYFCDRVFHF